MKFLFNCALGLFLCSLFPCATLEVYAQRPQEFEAQNHEVQNRTRPPRLMAEDPPVRTRQRNPRQRGSGRDNNRSPLPEKGKLFPSLNAYDEDGAVVKVPQSLAGNYTVLVRGCLTCPVFWRSYHEIEALSRDYQPLGVKFYFVYGSLAHPENNGYVQPFSQQERLLHVKEAKQKLKTTIPWLADNMDNELKWAMGNFPNSEVLLDGQGKVVSIQSWSNASELRKALEEHIGPSKSHTAARDLDLPTIRRERPTGEVLPRVEVKSQLTPVKVKPSASVEPHYAKLRVEVESSVLESGHGQVYLGFHLDPLYQTHWNNLADPLRFEITGPAGVKLTPAQGSAPEVEEVADLGPREFLIEVQDADKDTELQLTAYYYACSHDPDFCKAVQQIYTIQLTRDPFAGGVAGRSFRFGGRRGGRRAGR